jgi:hypothetical protein
MTRLRQLRRPAGHDHQEPRAVEPPRQISKKVRRRWIGPVHIVEPQHDRLQPPDFFEQRADLALEPFL